MPLAEADELLVRGAVPQVQSPKVSEFSKVWAMFSAIVLPLR